MVASRVRKRPGLKTISACFCRPGFVQLIHFIREEIWKMLDREPAGWRELQQKAQQQEDPAKLIEIIEQLNRLLAQHEKQMARETQNGEFLSLAREAGK
jgi:hypothetical protein